MNKKPRILGGILMLIGVFMIWGGIQEINMMINNDDTSSFLRLFYNPNPDSAYYSLIIGGALFLSGVFVFLGIKYGANILIITIVAIIVWTIFDERMNDLWKRLAIPGGLLIISIYKLNPFSSNENDQEKNILINSSVIIISLISIYFIQSFFFEKQAEKEANIPKIPFKAYDIKGVRLGMTPSEVEIKFKEICDHCSIEHSKGMTDGKDRSKTISMEIPYKNTIGYPYFSRITAQFASPDKAFRIYHNISNLTFEELDSLEKNAIDKYGETLECIIGGKTYISLNEWRSCEYVERYLNTYETEKKGKEIFYNARHGKEESDGRWGITIWDYDLFPPSD